MKRYGDDGTSVMIFWTILPTKTRRRRRDVNNKWDYGIVRYRVVDTAKWTEEKIVNVPINGSYRIDNLKGGEMYEFHFILYDKNGDFGRPVDIGKSK